jgi:GNAT superfamily N-acetyltransferase
MVALRFVEVRDERSMADWQRIHNQIIPTDPLTLDQVRQRAGRHRLELAYAGAPGQESPVGNSTVRRPSDEAGAVVIARVLPAYRRRGIGSQLYERGLAAAREWADDRPLESVVLASNQEGLDFALARGWVERERYTLPGATIPYVSLILPG